MDKQELENNFRSIVVPSNVQLLVASKSQSIENIMHLYATCNQRLFGENYAQELISKARELPSDIRWHFIGRIQSNKLHSILKIPNLEAIESVDNVEHLELIEKECNKLGRKIKIFVEVNSSGEDSKGGIKSKEVPTFVDLIERKKNVIFEGLMTIGSSQESEFIEMNELKIMIEEKLQRRIQLSMGMSGDWELAIKHGSTQVRIGTLIFGSRTRKENHLEH